MVQIPEDISYSPEGTYIAYVGRISKEKGIDTLIRAVKSNKLPLRLAGDYAQMPEVAHLQIENAKFVGRLNGGDLENFYRQARFTVIPSEFPELGPLVALESMSRGLPIIASRIGSNVELVEEGKTGLLFEPGNHEELAAKMNLLWQDKDLCRSMGTAAREKAIREHRPEAYYSLLMGAYQKAIEMNRYHEN